MAISLRARSAPRTGGRTTVTYRDSRGKTHDAIVTGGTLPNLNLIIPGGGGGSRILTGIAKATTRKQTNRWF